MSKKQDGKWIKIQGIDVIINNITIMRCYDGWIQHSGKSSFIDSYNRWCLKQQSKEWVPYIRGVSFSDPEEHKADWPDKWFVSVNMQSYDRDHQPGSKEPWEWRILNALFIVDDMDTNLIIQTIQETIDWAKDSYLDLD